MGRRLTRRAAFGLALAAWPAVVRADRITFTDERGRLRTLEGRTLGMDPARTVLFESRDLRHFVVPEDRRKQLVEGTEPVAPLTKAELKAELQREFGTAFKILPTNNYFIVHNASPEFAREAGRLFERAFAVFNNYFKQQGSFKLEKPPLPLVAVVLNSREDYVTVVEEFLGAAAGNTLGIYNPRTNRMYMYNAFGGGMEDRLRAASRANPGGVDQAVTLLKEQNISTVIHESVHQVAFNTGFHNRTVTLPYWLVEGMAMFFETPKLDAKGGWAGVGAVNASRLAHYRKAARSMPRDSFRRMLVDDDAFRDPAVALDYYAQAWCFTYFLAKSKSKDYMSYIRIINARKPLVEYPGAERLTDFQKAFGKAPDDFRPEFERFFQKVENGLVK